MEMLYETPYPTEPQNDLREKAQRNTEISARYEQGESLSELAAEYGISEQRVFQILHGQQK
jgi:Mor family transcriptional regulator